MDRRILVADDSEILLEAIAAALELAGYAVETATQGGEAVQLAAQHRPAVLVLDLAMPVLDGYGVARELDKRGLHIPIIAMTASDGGETWARTIRAAAYLPKPFDPEELLASIDRVLSQQKDAKVA